MALNNAQIMTYESLGKVLDYIDARDSIQAIKYSDALTDIKKVVDADNTTDVVMKIDGMEAIVDDKTVALSGMVPYTGNDNAGNPVFCGYTTAKYADGSGMVSLDVVVKFIGGEYKVESARKIGVEKFQCFGLNLVKDADGNYIVSEIPDEGTLEGIINEVCYKGNKVTVNVQSNNSNNNVQCVALEINSLSPASGYAKAVRLFSQHGDIKPATGASSEEFGILDIYEKDDGSYIATYSPYVPSGGSESGVTQAWVEAYTKPYSQIEKTKLAGIEEQAQKNVQSDWNATSGDSFIKNKPDVYTKTEVDGKFVIQVTGKDLSTNDYDNDAKAEVAKIANKADIDDVYTKTESDSTFVKKTDVKTAVVTGDTQNPVSSKAVEDYAVKKDDEDYKNVQADWNQTNTAKWDFIKNKPEVYTQDEIDEFLEDIYTKTEVDTELAKKVDKVTGKDLSTNDFTNVLKTKLDDLYTKAQLDTEFAKKVDKTADDYLTKAELITDGIKITPNKGSAIEYKLEDYVEEAELTSENLVKITQHDGTTVEQKPYLAKVETIQVDGLDEYKITDNKGVETKLDVYKRADTFGRDEDAVPTDTTTYGKKQIDDMIAALNGVTMKVVATVPAPADAVAGTIYICDGTMYLCYENAGSKVIAPIGGTAPDLTQYWKKTDGDLMSTDEHTKLTQDYTKAELDTKFGDVYVKSEVYTKAQADAKFVELEDEDYKNPDDYLEKVEFDGNLLKITPHGGTAVTQKPFVMKVEEAGKVYTFTRNDNTEVEIDITTAVTTELEAWLDTVLV